ncbi:MAG: lytic transglycosylase domain-containing protein [Spirochaetales bacterium]|nr:lytic transglycosylase domain-containing protein [Spirochaetales bacterium]
MRKVLSLLVIFICIIVLSSCSKEVDTILTASQFNEVLSLASLEDELPVKYIKSLEPWDSYFLALKALDKGFVSTAISLSAHCWENSAGLTAQKAAQLCFRLNIDNENFSDAEFFAGVAASENPEEFAFKKDMAEVLYKEKKDEQLLEYLDSLISFPEYHEDEELQLYKAVACYRQGYEDWKDIWSHFFLNVSDSELFIRGWKYLNNMEGSPLKVLPTVSEVIGARYNLYNKEYKKASTAFFNILKKEDSELFTEVVINDCEDAFISTGRALKGGHALEAASEKVGSFYCLFTALRLFRRVGYYNDARRCINKINKNYDSFIDERVLWYFFDMEQKTNSVKAASRISYYAERWEDPFYYEDILDRMTTELVRRQQWRVIAELSKQLEICGPYTVYDRCRYITEKAAMLGYIDSPDYSKPIKSLYYRILSGDNLDEFVLSDNINLSVSTLPECLNDDESYINGLIKYNIDGILDEVEKSAEYLSEDFLIYCADNAASKGEYLDSLRIMYKYTKDFSIKGYSRIYPAVYKDLIELHAKENDLSPQLLFALVWKESAFEKEIVSRAGAVGLTQLMPDTAEEVAGRIGISFTDLTDPDENLTLGSWYLKWLEGYTGDSALAVVAYNGGPGRVKRWRRAYKKLPVELFYECIPVTETHLYGKRVLTAAVIYGMIYYNIRPADTVGIFF